MKNVKFTDPYATLHRVQSNTEEDGYFDLHIKDFDLGISVMMRLSPEQFANLMSCRIARGYGSIEEKPGMRGKS